MENVFPRMTREKGLRASRLPFARRPRRFEAGWRPTFPPQCSCFDVPLFPFQSFPALRLSNAITELYSLFTALKNTNIKSLHSCKDSSNLLHVSETQPSPNHWLPARGQPPIGNRKRVREKKMSKIPKSTAHFFRKGSSLTVVKKVYTFLALDCYQNHS